MTTLKNIGPGAKEAATGVGRLLDLKDKETTLLALETLSAMGPGAFDASQDIIRLLEDRDIDPKNELRAQAVGTLAKIGKKAVPSLMNALRNPNQYIRYGAVEALGQMGPEAKEAVKTLQSMYKDTREDPVIRQAAKYALGRIQAK